MTVSKLFVDGFSLTVPVSSTESREAIKGSTLSHNHGSPRSAISDRYNNPRYKYYVDFSVTEGSNSYLTIGSDPFNPKGRYLWISMNPSHLLTYEDKRALRKQLSSIIPKSVLKTIYQEAKVTRTDFAVDISGVTPDMFSLGMSYSMKTKFIYGGDGLLETQSLGAQSSSKRLSFYDKNKDNEKRGRSIVDGALSRLEIQTRPSNMDKQGRIVNIGDLEQKVMHLLGQVHVYDFPEMLDDPLKMMFLDSYKIRGKAVLGMFDRAERAKFERLLKRYEDSRISLSCKKSEVADALSIFDMLKPRFNHRY